MVRNPLLNLTVRMVFAAMVAAALFAALAGGSGSADGPRDPMRRTVYPGSRPFTDSWKQMVARDAQIASDIEAGLRPALPELEIVPRGDRPRQKGLFPHVPAPSRQARYRPPAGDAPQTVGMTIQGITRDEQTAEVGISSIPPDTMGAIGPNHFVEILNATVAVFSRTTGAQLNHVSLDSFFAAGGGFPRNGAFDPRVLFDHRSGHWFACALERGAVSRTDNDIILAVSRTSDPTGVWDKFVIPVGSPSDFFGNTFFTDYDTLGVDDNGVYFGVNVFGGLTFISQKIAATDKASLLNNPPTLSAVTVFDNVGMFAPQPAHNHSSVGATSRAWFVSSGNLSNVRTRSLTWGGSPRVPTLSDVREVGTPLYVLPPEAAASGSGTRIDTGDDRLMMAVIRSNRLWTCRTVGVDSGGGGLLADRSAVEWMELNVASATPSLVQRGRVFDTSNTTPRSFFSPSVMVSGQGHAALGFSGCASDEFVSAFTCGRLVTDAVNTMRAVAQIRAGVSAYEIIDNVGRNRWGDYSYTSLDPRDGMTLWTVQEYADAGVNNWGTHIAALRAPAPTLANPNASGRTGTNGVAMNLTGTAFFEGGSAFTSHIDVRLNGGTVNGISNYVITFNGPTSLRVTFNIAANATPGPRTIVVTNPDGQSASVVGGFTVTAPPAAPSNLVVSPQNAFEMRVQWRDNSNNEDRFLIERRVGTAAFAQVGTSGRNVIVFQDEPLTVGTTYCYRVRAQNAAGNSGFSNIACARFAAPNAPENLRTSVLAGGQVQLNWRDKSDDETGFHIDMDQGGEGFIPLGDTGPNIEYFMVGLQPNQLFTFRVSAFNLFGRSSFIEAAARTSAPAAPSGLVARGLDSSTVRIGWLDNSLGETRFRVERRIGTGDFVFLGNPAANSTTTQDGGLTANTTHTYRIRAENGIGVSSFSAAASVVPLGAPRFLTATSLSTTSVRLNWRDGSLGFETGFRIERQVNNGGFAQIAQVGANVITLTVTVDPTKNTNFRVRARSTSADSSFSNTVTVGPAQ